LLGSALRDRTTWSAWRAFLAALFGLPMSEAETDLFRGCTGRTLAPATAFTEAWLVCGRRAGKSFVLALIAVFLAVFKDWRPYLATGERATCLIIATDRKQARVIFRYVRGLLSIPMLAPSIEREAAEAIDLNNRVSIEISVASYRTTRGYTLAAVLCDELAFWRTDDSAEPDYAILDALRPGLGTLPGAMLLCASSPYAQSGALFDAFRRYHGRDDAPVLVWKAPTRVMNPTFPQAIIDAAMDRDIASATAEYLAEFRTDVQAFVAREAVEACVSRGLFERAPVPDVRYFAFVDPSGGSSDSMTMAIAHVEGDVAILDCVRERKPPFSPEAVVAEFADVLRAYRCSARGDRYAGEWPREAFRKHGIEYLPASKVKSEIYVSLLPAINSRRCDFLDNERLIAELCGLERRTARGGRDSIDHRPGAHDDLCNAVAGAIVSALEANSNTVAWVAPFIATRPHTYFGDHPGY
jgi:Terminase large subunit, T4likevirus-type, N-terminal